MPQNKFEHHLTLKSQIHSSECPDIISMISRNQKYPKIFVKMFLAVLVVGFRVYLIKVFPFFAI